MKSLQILILPIALSLSINAHGMTHEKIALLDYVKTQNPPGTTTTNEYKQPKKALKVGDKGELVEMFKSKLDKKYNYQSKDDIFDKKLSEVVKLIQEELGLNKTGVIDEITWVNVVKPNTETMKNIIDYSIKNIETLEKNALDKNLSKFIIVNLPSFTLRAVEREGDTFKTVLSSPVIVGKQKTPTPLIPFDIWGVKYNPTWTPTPNMLKKHVFKNNDIDFEWLQKHQVEAFTSDGEKVDFEEIDVESVRNYKFMQPAGTSNALGLLKFETNHPEDVYLHDTNERHYFNKNIRMYSSGCIRVKEYLNLASWVSDKPMQSIRENIEKSDTYIEKTKKLPVFILYNLVDVQNNKVLFYPDIYGKTHFFN